MKITVAFSLIYRLFLLAILLLIGVCGWRYDWLRMERFYRYPIYPNLNARLPEGNFVHGIDLSKYNGEVHWQLIGQARLLGQPLGFVFVRATDGTRVGDGEFLDNWESARRGGFVRGAYHFFRPRESVKAQFLHFKNYVQLLPGDLPPVLDVEQTDGLSDTQVAQQARKWLQMAEAHYRCKPLIYSNIHLYEKIFQNNFTDYPLWIANYYQKKPQFTSPRRWHFWQHSDRATLHGINGRVDLNVFAGTRQQLKDLCKK
jgi:lysozyme